MKTEPTAASRGTDIVSPQAQAIAPSAASAPAQPAPRLQKHPAANRDDVYRQIAVEDIALALTHGGELLAHCHKLADLMHSDALGTVNAAARLMNAQANLARALAQVAQVERRSRSIVETIQKPDPENAGLNSLFSEPKKRNEIRDALERALLQFLEEQKQDRERKEGLAIEACI